MIFKIFKLIGYIIATLLFLAFSIFVFILMIKNFIYSYPFDKAYSFLFFSCLLTLAIFFGVKAFNAIFEALKNKNIDNSTDEDNHI